MKKHIYLWLFGTAIFLGMGTWVSMSSMKNEEPQSVLATPSSQPEELLNPIDFGLPPTAKEVPTKRTERSATFEISPGHFAAVSVGGPLFTPDADGNLVAPKPSSSSDIQ